MADQHEPAAKRVCQSSLTEASREELLSLVVLLAFKSGKKIKADKLAELVPQDVIAALKTYEEADEAYGPHRNPFGSHAGKDAAMAALRKAGDKLAAMADQRLNKLLA